MTIRKLDAPYEGEVPEDFEFPQAGIETADRALFDMFDKKLPFQVKVKDQEINVPVVFSTGERFALTRRRKPIRDRNNTIILPIISIHRTGLDTSPTQGGYGTPISFREQQSYVVRKRLDSKDRNYQNIVNKMGLKNQHNVSSRGNFARADFFPGNIAKAGRIASRRNLKNLSYKDDPSGDLLRDELGNNIFEIISIPYPTFVTLNYEITFWTQYMQTMNQLLEVMFAQFSGQGYEFKIESPEGYEYVAYLKSPLNSQDNFSDFSSDERVIKYTFNMTIPAYTIATQQPGMPSPFRKTYSAPQIEFGYVQISTDVKAVGDSPVGSHDPNKFILNDVKNLDNKGEQPVMRGQGSERLLEKIIDPFTGKETKRYVPVLTRHQRSGETVASSRITVDLETTLDTASD